MKSHNLLLTFFAITALIVGCKSSFVSPYQVRGLRVGEPIFNVKGMRLPDSTVRFSFITDPHIRTTDPVIRWVEASVKGAKSDIADTIVLNISNVPLEGSKLGQVLIGSVVWSGPTALKSNEALADVSVLTSSDHLVFSERVAYERATPVDLLPFSFKSSDSLLTIGAIAVRVYKPKEEYLPSSERFRVIISDQQGNVVWRSDAGTQFLTLVGSIEPSLEGRSERYAIPWNGVDLQGNAVRTGSYQCELIIPARPSQYTARTTIQWPPR